VTPFDPDAAAAPGSGVFGLPHSRDEAAVILIPAPFDATTSYRSGAAQGPAAILAASHQVDLFDLQTGRPYEAGIHWLEDDGGLQALSDEARQRAAAVQAGRPDADAVAAVDEAGARVNAWVRATAERVWAEGKIAGVIGGDHSVAFGGIAAAAAARPGLGVLHIDAHADLRQAYQGFAWSHASIMHNVLAHLPGVARLVQVGVRDLGGGEMAAIASSGGRVVTHFDLDWARRLAAGEPFAELCREAVAALPEHVYVSFDIDGLDPAHCPHTGTPVPGGLSFLQACLLLETVHRSGRRIVGFDLTEVAPGPDGDEWDAAVGARVLYKLCGFALLGAAAAT
jgi:agmatinase